MWLSPLRDLQQVSNGETGINWPSVSHLTLHVALWGEMVPSWVLEQGGMECCHMVSHCAWSWMSVRMLVQYGYIFWFQVGSSVLTQVRFAPWELRWEGKCQPPR